MTSLAREKRGDFKGRRKGKKIGIISIFLPTVLASHERSPVVFFSICTKPSFAFCKFGKLEVANKLISNCA